MTSKAYSGSTTKDIVDTFINRIQHIEQYATECKRRTEVVEERGAMSPEDFYYTKHRLDDIIDKVTEIRNRLGI